MDQLAICKHDRGAELGSTREINLPYWSERDVNPRPVDFKLGVLGHSAILQLCHTASINSFSDLK